MPKKKIDLLINDKSSVLVKYHRTLIAFLALWLGRSPYIMRLHSGYTVICKQASQCDQISWSVFAVSWVWLRKTALQQVSMGLISELKNCNSLTTEQNGLLFPLKVNLQRQFHNFIISKRMLQHTPWKVFYTLARKLNDASVICGSRKKTLWRPRGYCALSGHRLKRGH